MFVKFDILNVGYNKLKVGPASVGSSVLIDKS